jgi:hypothetical protein
MVRGFKISRKKLGSAFKRYRRWMSGLVLAVAAVPTTTWAIVDVQDEYYTAPDAEVLSAWSLDFSGATGNDARQTFSLETHNLWRTEDRTLMLIGSYSRADSGGRDTADNQFLHGRYVRALAAGRGIEGYVQTQKDRFQRLDSRHVIGVGYRLEREYESKRRLLLGIGGLVERERYVDLARSETNQRANIYLTTEIPLALATAASVSFSAYLQPKFDDPGDLRSIALAKFEVKISSALLMDLTVAYDHDSNPLSGVEPQNVRYASGLTYRFQR